MSTNFSEPPLCSYFLFNKAKKWLKITSFLIIFLFGGWPLYTTPAASYSLQNFSWQAVPEKQQAQLFSQRVITQEVVVTGYSSTPDQTDEDPFITASGKFVEDGIIATNFLPFGTKVRFPELFGEKVFIVEDRMHKRFSDRVDVWFPERHLAEEFGIQKSIMEIIL